MTIDTTTFNEHAPAPAGGQTVRLPGSDRAVALHDQLYRYAEDLQQAIERNGELEAHYEALRETSERLLESRAELDVIMHGSLDIHIVTDAAGTMLQSNPASAALAPPNELVGQNLQDWVMSSHYADYVALYSNLLQGNQCPEPGCELHLRREGGHGSPLIVTTRVMAVAHSGQLHRLHWILRDVTHLRETEFDAQVSSMVFKSASGGIMITDVEGEILAVNPAFTRITGYGANEVIGRSPSILNSGLQDKSFYEKFWQALKASGSWQGEVHNRKKSGEAYPEWLTVNAARDADGRILSYIAVFSDLSQMLAAEQRLSYLAHHDPLTGLANRQLLHDRLEQVTAQSLRSGTQFSLVFVDLDRLHMINVSHGHTVGDRALREAGQRLLATVRESDTVTRLGGDEFVIIAPGLAGEKDIARFCAKLMQALSLPIHIDGTDIVITGSLGCAEFPNHGADQRALLGSADAAMRRAKAAGGNCHVVFDTSSPDHQNAMECA